MALSGEQSLIWEAMNIGPQWLLRGTPDPLLEVYEQIDAESRGKSVARAPEAVASPERSRMQQRAVAPAEHFAPVTRRPPVMPIEPEQRASRGAPVRSSRPMAQAPLAGQPGAVRADPAIVEAVGHADWKELPALIARCHACEAAGTRCNVVVADGAPGPSLVIVGEAPGRDEDLQGIPFVGKSGQLLTRILQACSIERGRDVTIINVLKCRPRMNRDPQPDEIAACKAFLDRQLELLDPKAVILMGRYASLALTGSMPAITRERGSVRRIRVGEHEVPAILTFHPSYLLRNPIAKEAFWHDIIAAKRLLGSAQDR